MTGPAAPLATPRVPGSAPLGRLRAWLLAVRASGRPHDPTLRAGVERPAAPMVVSLSLGGVARLR